MTLRAGVLASALILLGLVATFDRVPIAWPDETLYASIARSLQRGEGGAPSVLAAKAAADDHLRFYGPVFFSAAAASFRLFGLSLASFRIVCLFGAVAIAVAAGAMAAAFGDGRARQVWVFALLLLTPEVGASASNGRMDSLAVGLALLALAVFVRGLCSNGARRDGVGAGVLLGMAALTTPRILPFVGAFVTSGVALAAATAEPRIRRQAVAAALACAPILLAWAIHAHGGPYAWLHDLASVMTAVGVDVAIAPTAVREWRIAPWTVISPLVSVAGGLAAARALSSRVSEGMPRRTAAAFALAVAWMNLVAVISLTNGTFAFGVYFALPLLAVVAALPWRWTAPNPAVWSAVFTALLAVDALLRTGKYVGAAATWSARDPKPIERFVRSRVPPDSDVFGEPGFYFYAVERSGSRMLSATGESRADWTAVLAHDARISRRHTNQDGHRRFLLWPVDESIFGLPADFTCARSSRVAVYEAPAITPHPWLKPLVARLGTAGYPASALYELGPGCPSDAASSAMEATSGATATSR